MPDITFFHKTHLDEHFPVVDLYNEEHKVRWTQSLFLNENDQNVLMSLPFSFNRRKIDKGLRGKALGWVLALTFPNVETLRSDGGKKKDWSFFSHVCLGSSSLFGPLFWISFLLTSSPLLIVIPRLKREDRERERDASVCCCSYR